MFEISPYHKSSQPHLLFCLHIFFILPFPPKRLICGTFPRRKRRNPHRVACGFPRLAWLTGSVLVASLLAMTSSNHALVRLKGTSISSRFRTPFSRSFPKRSRCRGAMKRSSRGCHFDFFSTAGCLL